MLSDIIEIKDINSDDISLKINDISKGVDMRSYSIPTETFNPSGRDFDENVLGMQMFLYINDFWSADNITGEFDNNTKNMLMNFQKENKIITTRKFDEATMFVARAFNNHVSLYENYGDERLTLGFHLPGSYLSLFSKGMNEVRLNNNMDNSSLITKIGKECDDCPMKAYPMVGDEIFTLGKINILNNVDDIV